MNTFVDRFRDGRSVWRVAVLPACAIGAAAWYGTRVLESAAGASHAPVAMAVDKGELIKVPIRVLAAVEPEDPVTAPNPFVSLVLTDSAPSAHPEAVNTERSAAERIQADAHRLTLRAVVVGDNRLAMINGKPYREGDSIEGFRLKQIHPNSAVVEKAGTQVTLHIR